MERGKIEVCGVDASMNMKEIFSDVLANYDSEVIKLISEKYGFSEMESMRKFFVFRNLWNAFRFWIGNVGI